MCHSINVINICAVHNRGSTIINRAECVIVLNLVEIKILHSSNHILSNFILFKFTCQYKINAWSNGIINNWCFACFNKNIIATVKRLTVYTCIKWMDDIIYSYLYYMKYVTLQKAINHRVFHLGYSKRILYLYTCMAEYN